MTDVNGSPSRIPTAGGLRRSASMRVRGERPLILYSASPTPFPSISETDDPKLAALHWTPVKSRRNRSQSQLSGLNLRDDDLDSVESFMTNASAASHLSTASSCEHSPFAKNGTTYSARTQKYVVHCSRHANTPEEYLTPTQRANRNVHRLKSLLQLAREKLMEKEQEIVKLTQEVVELKIFKASVKADFSSASTPSEKDQSSLVTDGPRLEETGPSPCCTPEKLPGAMETFFRDTPDHLLSSLADSGHFDDLASSLSIQSKDSHKIGDEVLIDDDSEEKEKLIEKYENILKENKEVYEKEMASLKMDLEEKTFREIEAFSSKLKLQEEEFENKFQCLVDTKEKEKKEMIEVLEKRLEVERESYKSEERRLSNGCDRIDKNSFNLQEEKVKYEKELAKINEKFNMEREKAEKAFDDAMKDERLKFEASFEAIQADFQEKLVVTSQKCSDTEKRFSELMEKYEASLLKIKTLEIENESLKNSLDEQETRQKDLYLKMFLKGQEAVKLEQDSQVAGEPVMVTNPELLVQLKVTEVELENLKDREYRALNMDHRGVSLISAKEALALWMLAARKAMYKRLWETQQRTAEPRESNVVCPTSSSQDPEATLQFLKSAVYYFLTDRDNHLQHLRAIENILGFSQQERMDIHMNSMR